MQIIDLSLPIDDKAFEVHHVEIERISHKEGIDKFNRVIMGKTLKGKLDYALGKRIVKKHELPDEEFLSLEIVHSPVHIGTHLDYSFHYGSKSENRASKTAEEIPLEWCYQDGVKLDMKHKKPNETINAGDIEQALKKIKYTLKPLDKKTIIKAALETGIVITAEEHQIGGLGNWIASSILEAKEIYQKPILFGMVGVKDRFGESGQPWELIKEFEVSAEHIAARAKELYDIKKKG
jgi:hypothetical protein